MTRAYQVGYAVGLVGYLGLWTLALAAWPLTLYVLPAVLAYARGHPHRHGILVWTLALGWTGTGWLAALLYTLWTWERTVTPLPGQTCTGRMNPRTHQWEGRCR